MKHKNKYVFHVLSLEMQSYSNFLLLRCKDKSSFYMKIKNYFDCFSLRNISFTLKEINDYLKVLYK